MKLPRRPRYKEQSTLGPPLVTLKEELILTLIAVIVLIVELVGIWLK